MFSITGHTYFRKKQIGKENTHKMLPYRVKGSTGSFSSVGCPNQLNARAELGNPPTFATNITMIIATVMHLVFGSQRSNCWRHNPKDSYSESKENTTNHLVHTLR
ncbi:hypothetical protein CY35_03G115500 [Sphagnum magellanicum]|nr:hypothetical protein CY35_03G115500 [Sphagnum magellanicum]